MSNEGGNPFAPVAAGPPGQARWPSDELYERVVLLGFGISDFEALIDAYGDPDFEETHIMAVGDVELRDLIAQAKGEDSTAHIPAQLKSDPTAVIGDNYGRDFEISWSIPALLSYVSDDARRAAWVLAAERAETRQRSGLVSALTKIIDHG